MSRRRYLEWKREADSPDPAATPGSGRTQVSVAEKTERIDRGWQTVFGLRRYLVLGSSVMALYGIRHPSKMIRWSRRAFGAWSAIRLFKRPSPPSKPHIFPSNILLLRPRFPLKQRCLSRGPGNLLTSVSLLAR